MSTTKRILLVGNTAWSMYNFRLGVAKALRASGYEVIIVAPFDHTSSLISLNGFQHINIGIDNKGMSPFQDLRLLKTLYSLYRQIRPDFIIHYTIKPNIYGGLASRFSGVKTISFVTGLGSAFVRRTMLTRLVELMYKLSFASSRKVWFLNDADYEYFTRRIVDPAKAEILPGEGVDTDFFHPDENKVPRSSFRFLFFGRILKEKGILEYIEAARLLKPKYKQVEFRVMGFVDALNPSAVTEAEIREWENEGLIAYDRSTTEVKAFIDAADCVVLPSFYKEGISRTLLEAASMKKPIIATDVPGCREIVDDGVTGFLCKVKDSKDLSLRMEAMIRMDVAARLKMGERGRQKVVREFDEQLIVKKYLDTICSMCS